MSDELKQVFTTPDGKVFESKAEAQDHLRAPKIKEALMVLTDNNEELADWLTQNRDVVSSAFDKGSIRRITKSDQKKIDKAFDAMAESGDSAFAFMVENREEIEVKYKTVKRMDDAEKAAAARQTILDATDDNNEELADWVVAKKDAILEAFEAGKVKREVSPKAKAALAEYRAKKAAEKAEKEGTDGSDASDSSEAA
jgi:dsDNA-binding SOS-regulon protein